jgi:hypothetical protein
MLSSGKGFHSMSREKASKSVIKPISNPRLVNHAPSDEIVAHELIARTMQTPSAQTLTPAIVKQLQRTHGNHFVQRLVQQSQMHNDLSELGEADYPEVDPNVSDGGESKTAAAVVQRNWDDNPLIYTDMSNEKNQLQIHTGAWKVGGSVKDKLDDFHKALRTMKQADAKKALDGLKSRLVADKALANKGSLKKPKNAPGWNKATAKQNALTFFNKWIASVDDHLQHINGDPEWIYDFRQQYIHDAEAQNLNPKTMLMENVAKLQGITQSDVDGISKMYDLGDLAMKNRMLAILGGRTDLTRMVKLQYFLEQASPMTLGYAPIENLFRTWWNGVQNLGLTDPWQTWMQQKVADSNGEHADSMVDSYDQQERAKHRVQFVNNQLLTTNNDNNTPTPLPSKSVYVLSANNEWYAKPLDEGLHHSSFMQGIPVKCAGDLYVNNGTLTKIDNNSGHYQPDAKALQRAVAVLKAQMGTTNGVNVKLAGQPTQYTVDQFLSKKF